jgi:hypothetical protein
MSRTTGFYVAIFATAALAVGWYGAHLKGATSELAGLRKRISGAKSGVGRYRSITVLIAVITSAVLYIVAMRKFK